MSRLPPIVVRNTQPGDFPQIAELSQAVYPGAPPWNDAQLRSHLDVFPEGQFVAVETPADRVVGMAASLIVLWDDYGMADNWALFTGRGLFTNHDPARGRTLYGAEVMVHPQMQRRGVGKKIYAARRELARRLKLLRIRAGARLRNYHLYANRMTAEDYVMRVCRGELRDPTLTFQLKAGFHVLAVVSGYLQYDPDSRGYAAVIEWLNEDVARPEDYAGRKARFPNVYAAAKRSTTETPSPDSNPPRTANDVH